MVKNKMLQIKKSILALTFCLAFSIYLITAQPDTRIFINPIDSYVDEEDNFTITVNATSSDIFATEFDLYFNSTTLYVISVEEGSLLSENKINSTYCFMTEHFPAQFQGKKCYNINNSVGKINFVNTRLNNVSISGSGSLAKINFRAKSNGTSSLDLQNVKTLKSVNSELEYIINLSITNGNVYVDQLRTVNISLKKGWNLFSIPLNLTNNSINSIFNQTNITIYSYKNNSFFVPNEIDNKLGYWVKINESVNLTLIGYEIENKTIELNEEWNLISHTYLTEININNSNLRNHTIFTYINNSWLNYNPNKINLFNTLKKLTPGYGYWVKK